MQCPNPACGRNLFKVRVVDKQITKETPTLTVELFCAHCKRKIKVWVTNENLKLIASEIKILVKGTEKTLELLKEIEERTKRKGFFDGFLRRFKKGNGGEIE